MPREPNVKTGPSSAAEVERANRARGIPPHGLVGVRKRPSNAAAGKRDTPLEAPRAQAPGRKVARSNGHATTCVCPMCEKLEGRRLAPENAEDPSEADTEPPVTENPPPPDSGTQKG